MGDEHRLPASPAAAAPVLREVVETTSAEWLLFWDGGLRRPLLGPLLEAISAGVDCVHAGLRVGTAGQPEALDCLVLDWNWLDPPEHQRATSWRVSLRCALVRTAVLRVLGGLDPAFETLEGAGLELGYRLLRRGAVVVYEPGLVSASTSGRKPTARDAYVFVHRWFKPHWAHYLSVRRGLRGVLEMRAAGAAKEACSRVPGPDRSAVLHRGRQGSGGAQASVTAVIPTIGRYPYLPGALSSLAEQTIRPAEILVVDQNPPEAREPQVYEPYADLNVRVTWQDERGQSLARNAALAAASGDYVFLFEDDAIAEPDLIEQHLRVIQNYGADVSTGVSIPPPPTDYVLPEGFRFPRIAQTFSSGNSLLTRQALRLAGGFDRRYDHGVNADMDFGTRLYLAGGVIIHNPDAVMVHFKAPMGGLRVYGHWWAHSNLGVLRPFPPPTQLYYMLRFLSPSQRRERLLRFMFLAAIGWEKRQSHARGSRLARAVRGLLGLPFMPYRLSRSYSEARRMLSDGPYIPHYREPAAREQRVPVAVP